VSKHTATPFLLAIALPLAACSTSDEAATPDASFVVTEDMLTLTPANGDSVTLPLDNQFDRNSFIGAEQNTSTDPQQIIALSQSDDTYAALLIDRANGTTVDTFVGRNTQDVQSPTGQANLNGTYVGAFVPIDDAEEVDFEAYITGDVQITADFDAMTLGGNITNRTAVLTNDQSGDEAPAPFALDNIVQLTSTTINDEGSFGGQLETFAVGSSAGSEAQQTGSFSGLVGGTTDAPEIVGRITIEGSDDNPLARRFAETGVFAIGHAATEAD